MFISSSATLFFFQLLFLILLSSVLIRGHYEQSRVGFVAFEAEIDIKGAKDDSWKSI